jgi:hypothetical protein
VGSLLIEYEPGLVGPALSMSWAQWAPLLLVSAAYRIRAGLSGPATLRPELGWPATCTVYWALGPLPVLLVRLVYYCTFTILY